MVSLNGETEKEIVDGVIKMKDGEKSYFASLPEYKEKIPIEERGKDLQSHFDFVTDPEYITADQVRVYGWKHKYIVDKEIARNLVVKNKAAVLNHDAIIANLKDTIEELVKSDLELALACLSILGGRENDNSM